MRIRKVTLYKLQTYLHKPYHTVFGDLPWFDAVVAVVRSDSSAGAGESCALPGYSWENVDDVWNFAKSQASGLLGEVPEQAFAELRPYLHSNPFGVTPLLCALEGASGVIASPETEKRFPLVGLLNATKVEEIPADLEKLFAEGFTTIKFKIGFAVAQDIEKTRIIQSLLKGRGRVRLDANQKYSLADARRFAAAVPPEGIELLEQPFPADDWKSTETFFPECPYPLMLDESIYGEEDIKRVIDRRCASVIKLKIVKAGGLAPLRDQARMVLDNGLQLVMGNGVATDISCYHELLAGLDVGMTAAGEMNGYLKMRRPLIPTALGFSDGHAVLIPRASLVSEEEELLAQAIENITFE